MKAQRWQQGLWVSWLGVIVVLIVWQAVNTFEIVNPRIFPGPVSVLETALTRFPLETLLGHISASLLRVAAGFALGAGLGITLGILAGWYRIFGKMLWGPIEILRPIPPLAWIPIALIWFGLGESSKVFIIFLGAFFPIITNTYKGMATIDPMLIRAAQTMGVRGLKMLAQIAIPAALPDIAIGIRVGWSLSFGSLVAAEILAAQEGLGYMIMYARELGEINVIVYGIILIGVLNLATDFLIHEFLFKRRLRWHFGQR
jgi:ABC-type nitrate/sulfonate/bicarbonate transport system permease component